MPAFAQQMSYEPANAISFTDLLETLDKHTDGKTSTLVERFKFDLYGLTYNVRSINQHGHYRFLVTVNLGYLPFSIESSERRDAIRTIVMASQRLPNVRFSIDSASKISAGALMDPIEVMAPDFIFYPLVMFLQEARPFMDLIGTYLLPAVVQPIKTTSEEVSA